MSVEDCVRVCIVLFIEMCFIGKQGSQTVSPNLMHVLEDFNQIEYPWGSRIWNYTYPKLKDVLVGWKDYVDILLIPESDVHLTIKIIKQFTCLYTDS